MSKIRRIKKSAAGLVAVVGLVVTLSVGSGPPALATNPSDAPPGYGGPVATCAGTVVDMTYLRTAAGTQGSSYVQIWYSSSNSGTLCAKVFDNLAGSHHMEIVVRRSTWQTPWYDSGTYSTYAGGIQHFGSNGNCTIFFSRVTVNGTNYEDRIGLAGAPYPGEVCWWP
jgi:hypothetical protein